MVQYRRNRLPGGTFFFTATLRDRQSRTLTDHVTTLRHVFRDVRRERPFDLVAIVVLPDHLHAVWTLPDHDQDYAGRWKAIKARFTHALVRQGAALTRNHRGEIDLWQRRYWEHTIRDERDLARHVDYIHYNPVKHGLATRPRDWPYSSFHRYVRQGLLPIDWASAPCPDDSGRFGE